MAQRTQKMSMSRSDTLGDILERVLETGIVVAGDIKVNLNDVELLTVQIRLVVCSVDKADQMGLDWWKSANYLTSKSTSSEEDTESSAQEDQFEALNERLDRLEKTMGQLAEQQGNGDGDVDGGADENGQDS